MRPCLPPRSPYHKSDFTTCTGPTQFDPLFMENIRDLADTLVKIMIVLGIPGCKATATRSVIIKAFQFYDIKRHRFNIRPEDERSLMRCEVVKNFECKGMMYPMEALLCYHLLKRAIKAFFLNTPDHSIRNPITEAMVLKEHEHAWKHAAIRSIQIFKNFEGLFYNTMTRYEKIVMQLYQELYERFRKRAEPIIVEDYHPRGCVKKVIIGTEAPPKLPHEKYKCVENCQRAAELREYLKRLKPKELFVDDAKPLPTTCRTYQEWCDLPVKATPNTSKVMPKCCPKKKLKKATNIDQNVPRCHQCNCPQIMCVCDIDPKTGIVAIDCSQGPFQCQWIRDDNEPFFDPCILKPEEHVCPVDCLIDVDETSSNTDTCRYCECSSEDSTHSEASTESQLKKLGLTGTDGVDERSEELEKLMAKSMPQRRGTDPRIRCDDCALRVISTLPPLSLNANEPPVQPQNPIKSKAFSARKRIPKVKRKKKL